MPTGSPCATRSSTSRAWPLHSTVAAPQRAAARAASSLVVMPPRPNALAEPPAARAISGVISLDHVEQRRLRLRPAAAARVQAVDVGGDHEQLGADQVHDRRREVVVVAEADLLGRDGVVLVHDRHDAEARAASAACGARSGSARAAARPVRVSRICADVAAVPREAPPVELEEARSGRPRRRPASRGSSGPGATSRACGCRPRSRPTTPPRPRGPRRTSAATWRARSATRRGRSTPSRVRMLLPTFTTIRRARRSVCARPRAHAAASVGLERARHARRAARARPRRWRPRSR